MSDRNWHFSSSNRWSVPRVALTKVTPLLAPAVGEAGGAALLQLGWLWPRMW